VSHDLRAPLRAINGYAKFLLEDYAGKLDEEGKRFIDTICQNAEKMDVLISDMLNLSRVSRTEMKQSEVEMQGLVRAVYAELASQDQKEDFQLIIHPLPKVSCDHNLMKQVWHNLLGNALKYSSKSEKKEIVVEGRTEDGKAVFSIRDSGCGFDPKYTHKVFGVFQRLHRAEEYEGTGVGLAIVERIIRRHQGEVWAEGKPGLGAAFYFSLPLERKRIR
jgi:light-regulated signal transduction histidine kinase (bacteriophytochrome)